MNSFSFDYDIGENKKMCNITSPVGEGWTTTSKTEYSSKQIHSEYWLTGSCDPLQLEAWDFNNGEHVYSYSEK